MDNNFDLSINKNILDLSRDILSSLEINEVDVLVDQLTESRDSCDRAIMFLQNKIGRIPKRPLYYLNYELTLLPDQTRDIVRYAGDYVDHLIKHYAHERTRFFKKFCSHSLSLGTNIKNIKKLLGPELYNILYRYNKLIYVPAKHDFGVGNRPHLFSVKEAVIVCYITVNLAKKIINLSKEAEAYSKQQFYC